MFNKALKKAKENKKGFTLAELLIVVAIIAVLVAISIPIFTSQLEKSRDAVSVSNMRAAYAEAQAAWLTGSNDGTHVVVNTTAKTVTVTDVAIKSQSGNSWSNLSGELPFTVPDDTGLNKNNATMVFTYTVETDGSVTNIVASLS